MSIAAKDGTGAAITLASSGNSPDNLVMYVGDVIPGTAATKLGKAEDAAHTSSDVGVMLLAVREATATDLSAGNTDGDYEPLEVDASGRLWVNAGAVTPGVAAGNLGKAEDAAHSSGDTGVMLLAVREAAATDLSAGNTDGDYEPLQVDASGRLHTAPGGSGALFLGKAEDAAHGSSDVGIMSLGVRKASDTDLSAGATDGDYEPIQIGSTGRLKVESAYNRIVVTVTPTLDTSIYAAGDTLFDVTDCGAISLIAGAPVTLESITLLDEDDQTAAEIDLVFFDTTTTFGTLNAAPSISDANARKIVGWVKLAATDFLDVGGSKVASKTAINLVCQTAAADTHLYMAAMTQGTPTQTASGIKVKLGFTQGR